MWIEELPNGKFKFCERYFDEKTGKTKKVSTTLTSKSTQAAKKATQILMTKIAKNKIKKPVEIRFGPLMEEFIEFKKKHWARSTYIKNLGFYTRHIKDTKQSIFLLSQMTLKDIQSIIDTVQYNKKLSYNTIVCIKSLIGQTLGYAESEYNLYTTLKLSDLHIKKNDSKSIPYIDSEDLPDTLTKIRSSMNELYADIVEVQILTGARIGELRALTKDDWKDGKININKSIERKTNKVVKPKTEQSNRVIDSSDRINEIFERRIHTNDILYGEASNLIFASQFNGPITYTYLQALLKKVDKNLSTHVFRHTHISLLAENGFDLKYIMDRVGHSNPDTTLKVYTHVTNKMKKEARKKLNSLF